MKLLKKTVLVIVLMVALTVSAFSQVYVSAGGSALLPVEIGDSSTSTGSIDYGLGIRGAGAVGYDTILTTACWQRSKYPTHERTPANCAPMTGA